jgi:trigger factor
MKHTVSKITPSKVKISVEVDPSLWKKAQEKAFNKVSASVVVKGFRPGKAPKELLKEHTNPETVINDAIDDILSPVYAEVLTEEKLQPFMRPSVNIAKLSDTELTVEYTVVLAPVATVGTYKGLKATKEAPSVTAKEVTDSINKRLEGNASLVVVDRPAKNGDTVVLDFLGKTANEKGEMVAFDGGTANNYSLTLGSHQFVPGFEEALVGVKPGEKKDVNVTFPEHYVKELAGKKAVFSCTIHEVKEKQIPALTDDAVKELAIKDGDKPVDTIAKLQDYEKAGLLKSKLDAAENKYYGDILDQIVAGSKYEIADEIIAEEGAALEENLKKQVEQNGLTFEQYLDITGAKEEDLKKNFHTEAEKNIKTFLALEKVAESEKITVSDDDVKKEADTIAKQYNMKVEDVMKYINSDVNRWKGNIRDRKIKDYLLSVSK